MSATDSAPRLEKLQQQVEELCGATVRAAAPAADFTFRGRKPERSGRFLKIRAPHLRPDLAEDDYQSFRGAADGLALRIRYSDEELHQKLMPEGDIGQVVFEILEQLRVESLVPAHMAGTKDNLIHRFTRWCRAYSASNMIENHIGLLVYTIAQSAWSRITGLPVDETTEDLIEPNRMMLAPHIGGFLRNLSKHGHDQELFAQSALGIVEVIEEMVEMMTRDPDDPKQENKSKAAEQAKSFSLLFFPDEGEESLFDTPSAGSPARNMREISQQLAQYQVFSKEHDRITPIEKLVRTALIDDYRTQLDKRVAGQGVNLPRLTRQLSQILSTPVRDGWQFGEEDGYLDGARLTRLLTSPNYRQLFKQERYKPQTDAAVTLLIDNTGSMKQYIESVATLVEIFAKALDGAGASSEILGYSTRSWKAGPLYKKWQRSGSPDNPGRLCELQHIIYKDADTPWRRARRNLAGMLKADIHKEGVEGEALLWASERLLAREESRKILIVLCDGCPMETATNLHNPEHYLDNHLKQVAQMLEMHPDIELYALGFGLDLSPYYSANLALDLPDILENRVFNEIVTLLARGQRRR